MALGNKKTILIVTVLGFIFLFGGVLFAYQWWQGEKELVNQANEREILLKQLSEIKKQPSFVQCRKLNIKRDDPPFPVYLLNSFIPATYGPAGKEKEERPIWNLIIINPSGYGAGIPGMTFEGEAMAGMEEQIPVDINEDGKMDRVIVIADRKIGDYLILVAPRGGVSPTDTYSLQLDDFVLAKEVSYSPNQLDHIYILRQTETGIIPIIPASVGCKF